MGDALSLGYYLTPEAYLAAERTRTHKHEYLAGVEYQMAGANARHNRITGNLFSELRKQLSGTSCEVFASDLRVRIRTGTAEFYYYPDVTVDCSGLPDHAMFAEHPRVICEVLSVETGRIDRGEKLRNYQALPSLEAYVIIDTKQMAVTVYRRERGDWVRDVVADPNASWSLPALGVVVPLSAIYQRSGLQHREPSAP